MDVGREGRLWRVREGIHYVFHLEPPLDEDADLAACLIAADDRFPHVRSLLGQEELSGKAEERFAKPNYWLIAEPWPPPGHVEPAPPARRSPWGKSLPSGLPLPSAACVGQIWSTS